MLDIQFINGLGRKPYGILIIVIYFGQQSEVVVGTDFHVEAGNVSVAVPVGFQGQMS